MRRASTPADLRWHLGKQLEVAVALRDEHGIFVGTSGHAPTLRLMPPLTTPMDAAGRLADALGEVLRAG